MTVQRRPVGLALLLLASVALVGGPASAQPDERPTDSTSKDSKARALYKEADDDYAAGRYELAAEKFAQAYELSKRPRLLFNLANTHERMGDYGRAAEFLKRYLESPKVKDVVSIRERIRRLEATVEARNTGAAKPEAADVAANDGTGAGENAARAPATSSATDTADASLTAPDTDAAPGDDRRRSGPVRWPSYVLMGVGGAAAAGSVLFAVAAQRAGDDADGLCAPSGAGVLCQSGAKEALQREKRHAFMSDISTAVAVTSVGVAVYLLLRKASKADESVSVTPVVIPDGRGLSLGFGVTGRL